MKALTAKLNQLQDRLESAAFLATQGSLKEAHSEIFRCTAALSEIRQLCSTISVRPKDSGSETFKSDRQDEEVERVKSRLRLWATRQGQYNSRILNGYLKLERLGAVTESALRRECTEFNFGSNFAQMKNIADRNHGKIFDHHGDDVTLWPPIVPYVREYEKTLKGLDICAMTKNEAIQTVNLSLQTAVLSHENTHWANVISYGANQGWWLNIPFAKFSRELHLILNSSAQDSFIHIAVPADAIPSPRTAFRNKGDSADIFLPCAGKDRLIDVQSGSTRHDFSIHRVVEHRIGKQ